MSRLQAPTVEAISKMQRRRKKEVLFMIYLVLAELDGAAGY